MAESDRSGGGIVTPAPRKGAAKVAAVTPEILARLHAGAEETLTLSECLAVDFAEMARGCLSVATAEAVTAAVDPSAGITKRMAQAAGTLPDDVVDDLITHPSDTIRGWAAFALAGRHGSDLEALFSALRPLAADSHFGVREWAWLAARPAIVAQPMAALSLLMPWTGEGDETLRRFASEATRPRGVWCSHIAVLKADPEPARLLLEPLKADPSKYVRDSVANWLNDAAKTRPDWVLALTGRWLEGATKETAALVKRARRSFLS
ncbi:MAG: DNA alkylation repair protein [Rhodospirillum sp.]|nr:DNA alkylation repair protein [Rhodospirillum sp.]MCF8490356.1 DNA alkylation repair protein [Rhodospirillum sp.]MCF8501981.1 DNA alkylation repair protein [Rhodospirillum sp.]